MRLAEVYDLLPLWFLRASVVLFGLLWGSFLNVVIYRVPLGLSVVHPPSHCPGCGKQIEAYDNIPVFTYVLLRGRARCCGARMSPRYPIVELIGGLLSLAIFEVVIRGMPEGTNALRAAAVYGADFALCLGLVAAAFIDAEHMFLPDAITLGGIVVGVLTATLRGFGFVDSLVGAAVGFVGIWLPFIFLYKGLLGRTGMGLGDAKLVALAGAWFGWQGALFSLMAGALHGTLFAGVTHVFGIEPKLPKAVQEDIAELRAMAAEGDEEAQKFLREDPLTEDEDDAFLLAFFRRFFGIGPKPEAPKTDATTPEAASTSETATTDGATHEATTATATEAETASETATHEAETATEESATEDEAAPRARIPFGPFLILAILELLFVGDWLRTHLLAPIWP